MATFLHHEPCPACGSRDNLARYSDNSGYCFGCNYIERGTAASRLAELKELPKSSNSIALPKKTDEAFNHPFLLKYSLSKDEIISNNIYMSGDNIVFPIYEDKDNLVGKIIRHFSGNRKYTITGNKLEMSLASLKRRIDSKLVFVEDLISCIKVNRQEPCICLFGTHIPSELILRYLGAEISMRLWLDPDKKKDALKQALNWRQKGFDISPVIQGTMDPKDYSDTAIREMLQ